MRGVRDVRVVLAKEILDAVRDRRTLLMSILLPLVLMPLVNLTIPALAERQQRSLMAATSRVAVVGAGYAPDLVQVGEAQHLFEVVAVPDPERALRGGEVGAVLVIPEDFRAKLDVGRRPTVRVLYNPAETESVVAREKILRTVAEYSQGIITERLRREGLSVSILVPIELEEREVAGSSGIGQFLPILLPFFVAMWAVLGGVYAAVDVAAGEKERNTLEALLATPPPRAALVGGKYLAVLVAAGLAVTLALAVTVLSFRYVYPLVLGAASSAAVGGGAFGAVLLVGLTYTALAAAVELLVSILANSVREANQYLTPIYIVVAFPFLFAQFLTGLARSGLGYAIPAINAAFTIRELLLGITDWGHIATTVGTNLAAAGLFLAGAVALFSRESVLGR